jgi:hypothetical protein
MKLTSADLQHLVEKVFQAWKKQQLIQFKADEKAVFARALKALQDDLQREYALDEEVQKMLDDLERSHGGSFQRAKMRGMLKQKLAQERKVIL